MAKQVEVIIEIIFHATEDSKKIFQPLFELFHIREDECLEEKILGVYGNPIILVRTLLTKNRAEGFVKNLISRIPKSQLEELFENIEMYLNDSSLFLRIGKNDLVNKIINLQQNNAVKIRIKIPIYKKNEIEKVYKELLRL